MPNLIPEVIPPEELRRLAQAVIARAKFPHLATVEASQPRVRPVSPVRVDHFTIYIANLRRYAKTQQLADNPQVELCYLDDAHDQVRITGIAEILTDPLQIREIWDSHALLRRYFPSPESPELIIYRVRPLRVRYMKEWALEYHEVPLEE